MCVKARERESDGRGKGRERESVSAFCHISVCTLENLFISLITSRRLKNTKRTGLLLGEYDSYVDVFIA